MSPPPASTLPVPPSAPGSSAGRPPGRFYYGWAVVGALALSETVSYGVLMYAFPVVLPAMEADLGWSRTTLTGAFSLAALTAGVFSIPVGRWIDRHGPRAVMTLGSMTAAVLLIAWSRVERPVTFYLVWIALGTCMAALFYEPAFTVVANWFRRYRVRAFTIITLAGGLASTIFVPLTADLLARGGWRYAVLCLAGVFAGLTVLPHALVLRRRPADLGLPIDGIADPEPDRAAARVPGRSVRMRDALRGRSFRWLGFGFFLSTLTNAALAVHLIPLLLERGFALTFASMTMAAIGPMKLVGRLVIAPLIERWSAPTATTGVILLQALGLVALAGAPGAAGVWTGVAVIGAGDGASTPARAVIVAERFGTRDYGAITGAVSLFLAAARAVAPFGASVAHEYVGGYGPVLWLLAGAALLACLSIRSATREATGSRVPA